MDYQAIKLWNRNGVATITMKRPDVMNALNAQMRAEITHAVKDLQDKARVIVLTGQGKAFCSGQDLGDGAVQRHLIWNERCGMNMSRCCGQSWTANFQQLRR